MKESEFYQTLVNATPKQWMWQRIETTTALGVPDVNLFGPSLGEMWIETKLAKSGRTILRSAQHAWIIKRIYLGGKCAVISKDKHLIKIWNKHFNVVRTVTDQRLEIVSEPDYTTTIVEFQKTIEKILTKRTYKRRKRKV